MNRLKTIIYHEYMMDIRGKGFWIATFLMPVLVLGFGMFIGFLAQDSDALTNTLSPTAPGPHDDLSGMQIVGMLCGMFLTLFVMVYGAQIFNKVKNEKTNRIVEIIVASVPGRDMMLAKVISVGLVGLTQLLLWGLLIGLMIMVLYLFAPISIPISEIINLDALMALMWAIIYFIGGYVFYGSMFAAVGALTDKNNENQEYMTILTFILLGSFYIGMFAVDNQDSMLTTWCNYIPLTSPTVAVVGAISGSLSLLQSLISVAVLYASALTTLSFAGKIYTSALLLKGKKFSPKDILTFLKAK